MVNRYLRLIVIEDGKIIDDSPLKDEPGKPFSKSEYEENIKQSLETANHKYQEE